MPFEGFDLSILRRIPLLGKLPEPALEALLPSFELTDAAVGDVVIREGEPADRLFCLVKGEVQVVTNYLADGSHTVDVLGPFSHFGEMGLILDDAVRTATIVASEPSVFLTLDREAFRRYLLSDVSATYVLLVEVCRRLRQTDELLASSD